MKICPKCGSTEVNPAGGGILGILKCGKCGFNGTLFPDIEKLGKEENKQKSKKKKVKK